jgi:uncharacterized damage-inducible protein DinB
LPEKQPRGTLRRVTDLKKELHAYLRRGREAVVWKLDGLDEYAAHRPMTPTATSLLGLVKHLANVEAGYFGDTFARPFPEAMDWTAGGDDTADMWATDAESTQDVLGLYERTCRHADETISALGLEAPGRVPWWPEDRRDVTLGQVLVHVIAETHRHAGHADIVRELLDGRVGLRPDVDNLAFAAPAEWAAYYVRVEQAALAWRDRSARAPRPAEPGSGGASAPQVERGTST